METPVTEEQYAPDYTAEEIAAFRATLTQVLSREKVIKTEWLDKTKDTYDIYEGAKADETPFNILFSNTEILVPNLFSAAPKPVVRRRFGEERADQTSRAAERMAEYSMDTNLSGYPDFVEAIESCVLDAALPGQGQARVRLVGQTACIDYVQHDQFIWAYARRWEDTPWVAYRHDKTPKDIVKEFNLAPEILAHLTRTSDTPSSVTDKGPETLAVYEIWDKASRKVHFMTEAYPQVCLKNLDDPLGLESYFPSAKPLRLLSTPRSTMPRALYGLYKKQAEELNEISRRIKAVSRAIRVSGVYDGNLPEFSMILDWSDMENKLVPATNSATLGREGGLDKHVWMFPVGDYVVVLQQLYGIREQIKNTIYEILGIGDILRGVSAASETASAQEIKDKWGTLRIKKSREKVSSFVRAQIRLLIEVSAKHVSEDSWAKVTGLDYQTELQTRLTPPAPPEPGIVPPTTWAGVLGALRDDMTRSYQIDIETNSTVDGDATTEKAEIAEFMNALGQTMSGLAPLGASSPEGFAISKAVLMEVFKRYRMGNDLTTLVEAMKAPDKKPTPEQMQAKEELEKGQAELKAQQEQIASAKMSFNQQEMQKAQVDSQSATSMLGQQKALAEKELNLQVREAELALKEQELALRFREDKIAVQSAAHKALTSAQKLRSTPLRTP